MTIRTHYEHGSFSWVELGTTDSASAKKFYSALFGWTFDDMPAGPGMVYTMCKVGAEPACALYQLGDPKGNPKWESYITVNDVDATAKGVVEQGGTLDKEPFDVMDVGRMAALRDPTGAVVCLWQAKAHIGAGVINEPGAMCWNELFTGDPKRAGEFYRQVIGWKTEEVDMGPGGAYTLFKRPGETTNAGGMMPLHPELRAMPPHWLVYFAVTDCDASTKKATDLGGKLRMPPTDIHDIGRFSIVAHPQGANFALFKSYH